MGIQIKGSNDTIQAADGNLSIEGVSLNFTNENVTGISTMATGHITGTTTLDDDLKVGISTLFVDKSAGLIGIGTITPTRNIHIDGTAHQSGIIIHTGGNHSTAIDMDSNRSGAGSGIAELNFKWNGTTVGQIGAYSGSDTSNKDDGHIHFDTASAGSIVERLRIASTGNVSIGTQNVTEGKLQVAGDITAGYHHGSGMYGMLAKRKFDGSNALGGYAIRYASGYESPWIVGYNAGSGFDNQITFGSMTTSDRSLETGVTKRMVIDMETGNIGIGIANPTNKLEISGGLVRCLGTASARFTANNGSAEGFIGFNSGTFHIGEASATTQIAAAGANYITMNTNSNERLRIVSNGDVNIGGNYTQTAAPLCVTTDANTYGMRLMSGSNIVCDIMNNDSAGNSEIRGYYNNNSGSRGEGYRIEANGDTYFNPGGTTGVIIKSDGKVGINETNPNTNLHVEQDNAHSSTYYLNSDAAILVQNKNSSSTSKTVIKLEGPNSSPSDCAIVYGAGSSTLIFADRQNERIRIQEAGRILINTPGTSINAHEQCDDVVIGNVSHGHDTGVTIVSNPNYNGWIAFSDGTTNSTRRRGAIVYHHPSDTMYLRTNDNQTALQISSDGEVTKPRNPAFSVRHSVNQSVTTAGWTQKSFNTEIFDIGGNFASNAFTAPVDGIYSFGWNQRFDSGNGQYFRVVLRVNDATGSQYQHGHAIYRDDDGFHYVTLNLTSLLQLDAGDVVKAYAYSITDTSYTLQNESIFWGYLVS